MEDGAFLKLPAYLELAFISPEAKLYALERLEVKSSAREGSAKQK